ncbi:MAG: hypothetical protein NVSMB48_00180 [Marmoricola sp.]
MESERYGRGPIGSTVAGPRDLVADFSDMLSMFEATVARCSGRPAIVYFNGVLTWAELDSRSTALAGELIATGFDAGDRLAIFTQNDPGFVIALVAAWKAGGSAVMRTPMYRRREAEFILGDSGATALVCLDSLYADIVHDVLRDGGTALRQVIVTADTDFQTRNDPRVLQGERDAGAARRLATMVARERMPTRRSAERGASGVAALVYTAGTTGNPKGAMVVHGGMAFSSQVYRESIRLTESDRILAVAPLFHITGLVGHVGASLITGAAMVMHHRFDGDVVMDAIREHRPTFTVGSVTVFNNLSSRPDVTPHDFASFRAVCSGGAPIAPALSDGIVERTGLYLHNLYGMTECSGPAIGVPIGATAPVDPSSGALSIGRPVFNTTIRILDENGALVPSGEVGEIHVRGPQVVEGYWRQPEASAARIVDHDIATGDVGFVDDDGWCYLVDRKTDMINSSGYKVWPREVEDVLARHPAVLEAAVVGVPDAYRGETVKAFVVLRPGSVASEDDLIEHCRADMAAYKYPRLVELVDELPKSAVGKILRRELRARPLPR